jgi:hypothetical protein
MVKFFSGAVEENCIARLRQSLPFFMASGLELKNVDTSRPATGEGPAFLLYKHCAAQQLRRRQQMHYPSFFSLMRIPIDYVAERSERAF